MVVFLAPVFSLIEAEAACVGHLPVAAWFFWASFYRIVFWIFARILGVAAECCQRDFGSYRLETRARSRPLERRAELLMRTDRTMLCRQSF